MPVLPLVGSTMTPPGFSLPSASAAAIIAFAMRSLTLPAGFSPSILAHTSAPPPSGRPMRTSGATDHCHYVLRPPAAAQQGNIRWSDRRRCFVRP